jgi:hypothetical protein
MEEPMSYAPIVGRRLRIYCIHEHGGYRYGGMTTVYQGDH